MKKDKTKQMAELQNRLGILDCKRDHLATSIDSLAKNFLTTENSTGEANLEAMNTTATAHKAKLDKLVEMLKNNKVNVKYTQGKSMIGKVVSKYTGTNETQTRDLIREVDNEYNAVQNALDNARGHGAAATAKRSVDGLDWILSLPVSSAGNNCRNNRVRTAMSFLF